MLAGDHRQQAGVDRVGALEELALELLAEHAELGCDWVHWWCPPYEVEAVSLLRTADSG